MDQIHSKKKNEYYTHIKKQLCSGLSMRAYCSKHNLNYSSFCYHRKKSKSSSLPNPISKFVQAEVKGMGQNLSTNLPVDKSFSAPIDPVWTAQFIKAIWGAQ